MLFLQVVAGHYDIAARAVECLVAVTQARKAQGCCCRRGHNSVTTFWLPVHFGGQTKEPASAFVAGGGIASVMHVLQEAVTKWDELVQAVLKNQSQLCSAAHAL